MPEPLRVCALYPELMNIYADRGNLLLLERRCAWRGIGFELTARGARRAGRPRRARPLLPRRRPGPRPAAVRAGPRRDQARRAARGGRSAASVVLGVCGGYQLLGHSYELGDERMPGRRPRRPAHRARGRPAADRQRRDRGRARDGEPPGARRLREPRRPHAPRRRRAAARPRAARPRQRRAQSASRASAAAT